MSSAVSLSSVMVWWKQKCILLWMMDSAERDAILMYELMKVGGRKADRALIGIVCTRNTSQIYLIKQAYYTMFNQTLENHIDGTDSHFVEFQQKVGDFLFNCIKGWVCLPSRISGSKAPEDISYIEICQLLVFLHFSSLDICTWLTKPVTPFLQKNGIIV